jgi:PAS domain S-box-containing protein
MVATIRDITAEHEQNRRIGKINRVLKMLSEANQYLVRIAEERELLERICGVIVETGGYPVAWVGYIEKGSPSRIKPVASAGERKERLSENVPGMDEDSLREGFIGRALRSGSSAIAVCEGRGGGPGMRDEGLRRSGFSCAIALPLTIGEEVIGSLNIYAAMTGGGTKSVDEEEFGLLQQLGEDLSLRLSHLRSNEKRRRAEHALFKSETKYRKIFNNSNDAIYLHSLTEDGMPDKFLEVNDVACRQLGYSRDELLRMGPADIDSGTETERIPAIMEELNRSGAYTFEMRHRRKDGSELPVEISAHRFVLDEVPMVLSTARDVSHLRKVEQELREGERRYRELSIHLQHVREEQLARLSREIHDDLGQSLTALRMNLTVLERDIARVVAEQQRERINTTMEDVKSILMGTVQKTRELVKELRPTVLDTSGLLEALEWQVEEFRRFSGIDVRLHRGSEELELTGDRALAVFRIVQESLTNTARHSNASRVSVSVERDEEELRIDISDNGCGFDTEEANSSFGLLGMRERANFCGGSLSISSTGEGGTRVSLKIPQEELR